MTQQPSQAQDEMAWRLNAVSQSFESDSSAEDMQRALRICEQEFPPSIAFTASVVCQRLTAALPHITLSHETRLRFLRTLRQHEPLAALTSQEEVRTHQETVESPASQEEVPAPPENIEPLPLHKQAVPSTRSPRKPSHLTGVYQNGQNATEMGAMIVENLSLFGARMQLLAPHALTEGMSLNFQFRLDDRDQAVIRLTGQVRWVQDERIGVAFDDTDERVQTLIDYMAE